MAAIRFRGGIAAAALCLFAQIGCTAEEPAKADDPRPAAEAEERACAEQVFEGNAFTVCKFDAAADEIRLVWRGSGGRALRSFAALEAHLGRDSRRVRFAMNAGMYNEEGAPIGLYVEGGEKLKSLNLREGDGNFHLLPNGVFSVDAKNRVAVTPGDRFAKLKSAPRWATQSGPMLVINGKLHPKFEPNGPSRLIRNGVGVADPKSAFFVISEEGVSFGRFARFFRDRLGCANALYLDGSVSSLWDRPAGRQDAFSELGPMLVVSRR